MKERPEKTILGHQKFIFYYYTFRFGRFLESKLYFRTVCGLPPEISAIGRRETLSLFSCPL